VNQRSHLEAHLEKIRADINGRGESIVTSEELRALCPEMPLGARWEEIAKIGLSYRWAFTFFPNGDVRFAPLDS
jgi:hypothetical protein